MSNYRTKTTDFTGWKKLDCFQYVRPSLTKRDIAMEALKLVGGFIFALVMFYSILILFGNW